MNFQHLRPIFLAATVWLPLIGLPLAAQTTFNVNSTNDTHDATPGDGICSTGVVLGSGPECTLRAALDEANANTAGTYIINVPAGTYALTTTMNCPDGYYFPFNGIPLCFATNITLNGADPKTTIIDAGGNDSDVFIGEGSFNVSINNVTLQHGAAAGRGALYSLTGGTLAVSNSIFTANNSQVNGNTGGGSAINLSYGNLAVEGCTFTGNIGTAVGIGQGVTAWIDLSYFSGNTADSTAAIGAYRPAALNISNSTIANNTASYDYIISAYAGPLTMVNTTVVNNTVGNSTIVGGDTVVLNNDTIHNNSSFVDATTLTVSNSIIGNPNQESLVTETSFTDLGHNILSHGTLVSAGPRYDPTTQVNVDPMLGALQVNGGTIPTLTPAAGSPARSAGSPAVPGSNSSGACAALDERGFVRGRLGCTIGAVDPGAADPAAGLQVLSVLPATGAAGGISTVTILGTGFVQGTTVTLIGSLTISPTQLVIGASSFTIAATFDLTSIAPGTYDVAVTPPGGNAVTLAGGFNVITPVAPILSGFVAGPTTLREGRPELVYFSIQNRGDEDAFLVPIAVQVPGNFSLGILSPVLPPPVAVGQAISDFSTVPTVLSPVNTDQAHTNNYTYLAPVIPAHSVSSFSAQITAPQGTHGSSFTFDISLSPPYGTGVQGTPDPTLLSEFVQGAVDYAQSNSGQTLPQAVVDKMTAYATGQFASIVTASRTALLAANAGQSPLSPATQAQVTTSDQNIFYSAPQLSIDIAAYGDSLVSTSKSQARPHPESIDPNAVEACKSMPGSVVRNGQCHAPGDCGTAGTCQSSSVVGSVDPNAKSGPLGVGSSHFVMANAAFPYVIEFENSATATAPAQTVSVTDQLDTSKFDLSSFQLGPINFGSYLLTPPPGSTGYAGAIDLHPSQNIIVSVVASLNQSTGQATWNFTSLDPSTMQLTTNATAGFLPPDTAPPAGIGHVNFTINPLATVADATTLCNTASVVFDTNNPINTAQYCNTKDSSPPSSMVQPLASNQSSATFTVKWSGTDSGSGVGSYTIYLSDNGGAFSAWQTATTATSASYTGVAGHTYSFYSIATDLVGNVEASKTLPEATTTVNLAAAATFSPSSVAFGSVAVGSSAGAVVTVTSTGGNPLTITGFALSDTVNFSQINTCATALTTGQTCTVTVTFSPNASASTSGATTATLALASNAGTAPAPVALSGFAGQTGLQNVWVVNGNQTLSKLANSGSAVSPTTGYAGGGSGIAIDSVGNVWSGTQGGTSVVEFANSGTLTGTYTGAGISSPTSLAISGASVWIANANNTLSLLQSDGTALSPSTGFSGGGLNLPTAIAIDGSGNVWVANSGDSSLTEFLGATDPVVTPLANAAKNATQGAKP